MSGNAGYLVVYKKNGETSKPFELEEGECSIGSSADNDIRLKCVHPLLQEKHALIDVNANGVATIISLYKELPVSVNEELVLIPRILMHEDKFEVVGKVFQYFNKSLKDEPMTSGKFVQIQKNIAAKVRQSVSHCVKSSVETTVFKTEASNSQSSSTVESTGSILNCTNGTNFSRYKKLSDCVTTVSEGFASNLQSIKSDDKSHGGASVFDESTQEALSSIKPVRVSTPFKESVRSLSRKSSQRTIQKNKTFNNSLGSVNMHTDSGLVDNASNINNYPTESSEERQFADVFDQSTQEVFSSSKHLSLSLTSSVGESLDMISKENTCLNLDSTRNSSNIDKTEAASSFQQPETIDQNQEHLLDETIQQLSSPITRVSAVRKSIATPSGHSVRSSQRLTHRLIGSSNSVNIDANLATVKKSSDINSEESISYSQPTLSSHKTKLMDETVYSGIFDEATQDVLSSANQLSVTKSATSSPGRTVRTSQRLSRNNQSLNNSSILDNINLTLVSVGNSAIINNKESVSFSQLQHTHTGDEGTQAILSPVKRLSNGKSSTASFNQSVRSSHRLSRKNQELNKSSTPNDNTEELVSKPQLIEPIDKASHVHVCDEIIQVISSPVKPSSVKKSLTRTSSRLSQKPSKKNQSLNNSSILNNINLNSESVKPYSEESNSYFQSIGPMDKSLHTDDKIIQDVLSPTNRLSATKSVTSTLRRSNRSIQKLNDESQDMIKFSVSGNTSLNSDLVGNSFNIESGVQNSSNTNNKDSASYSQPQDIHTDDEAAQSVASLVSRSSVKKSLNTTSFNQFVRSSKKLSQKNQNLNNSSTPDYNNEEPAIKSQPIEPTDTFQHVHVCDENIPVILSPAKRSSVKKSLPQTSIKSSKKPSRNSKLSQSLNNSSTSNINLNSVSVKHSSDKNSEESDSYSQLIGSTNKSHIHADSEVTDVFSPATRLSARKSVTLPVRRSIRQRLSDKTQDTINFSTSENTSIYSDPVENSLNVNREVSVQNSSATKNKGSVSYSQPQGIHTQEATQSFSSPVSRSYDNNSLNTTSFNQSVRSSQRLSQKNQNLNNSSPLDNINLNSVSIKHSSDIKSKEFGTYSQPIDPADKSLDKQMLLRKSNQNQKLNQKNQSLNNSDSVKIDPKIDSEEPMDKTQYVRVFDEATQNVTSPLEQLSLEPSMCTSAKNSVRSSKRLSRKIQSLDSSLASTNIDRKSISVKNCFDSKEPALYSPTTELNDKYQYVRVLDETTEKILSPVPRLSARKFKSSPFNQSLKSSHIRSSKSHSLLARLTTSADSDSDLATNKYEGGEATQEELSPVKHIAVRKSVTLPRHSVKSTRSSSQRISKKNQSVNDSLTSPDMNLKSDSVISVSSQSFSSFKRSYPTENDTTNGSEIDVVNISSPLPTNQVKNSIKLSNSSINVQRNTRISKGENRISSMFDEASCTSTPFPKRSFSKRRYSVTNVKGESNSDKETVDVISISSDSCNNTAEDVSHNASLRNSLRRKRNLSYRSVHSCISCTSSSSHKSNSFDASEKSELQPTESPKYKSTSSNASPLPHSISRQSQETLEEGLGIEEETPKSAIKPNRLSSRVSREIYNPVTEDITPTTPENLILSGCTKETFKTPVNTPGLFESIRENVIRSRKRRRDTNESAFKVSKKPKVDFVEGHIQELEKSTSEEHSPRLHGSYSRSTLTPKKQKSTNLSDIINVKGGKDMSNLVSIKRIFAKSPKNDLTKVPNLKEFFSPKKQKTPKNDLINLTGIKTLLQTPNESDKNLSDDNEVSSIFNVSGVDILHQENDTENFEDPFSRLSGKKPIRRYQKGKSLSPTKNNLIKKHQISRKTIGDSPECSPRVQQWVTDYSNAMYRTEEHVILKEEDEFLEKSLRESRGGRRLSTRKIYQQDAKQSEALESVTKASLSATKRKSLRVVLNDYGHEDDIDSSFRREKSTSKLKKSVSLEKTPQDDTRQSKVLEGKLEETSHIFKRKSDQVYSGALQEDNSIFSNMLGKTSEKRRVGRSISPKKALRNNSKRRKTLGDTLDYIPNIVKGKSVETIIDVSETNILKDRKINDIKGTSFSTLEKSSRKSKLRTSISPASILQEDSKRRTPSKNTLGGVSNISGAKLHQEILLNDKGNLPQFPNKNEELQDDSNILRKSKQKLRARSTSPKKILLGRSKRRKTLGDMVEKIDIVKRKSRQSTVSSDTDNQMQSPKETKPLNNNQNIDADILEKPMQKLKTRGSLSPYKSLQRRNTLDDVFEKEPNRDATHSLDKSAILQPEIFAHMLNKPLQKLRTTRSISPKRTFQKDLNRRKSLGDALEETPNIDKWKSVSQSSRALNVQSLNLSKIEALNRASSIGSKNIEGKGQSPPNGLLSEVPQAGKRKKKVIFADDIHLFPTDLSNDDSSLRESKKRRKKPEMLQVEEQIRMSPRSKRVAVQTEMEETAENIEKSNVKRGRTNAKKGVGKKEIQNKENVDIELRDVLDLNKADTIMKPIGRSRRGLRNEKLDDVEDLNKKEKPVNVEIPASKNNKRKKSEMEHEENIENTLGHVVQKRSTRSRRKNTEELNEKVKDTNDGEATVAETNVKISSKNKKNKNKIEHEENADLQLQNIADASKENTLQRPAKRGRRGKAEKSAENINEQEEKSESPHKEVADIKRKNITSTNKGNKVDERSTRSTRKNAETLDGIFDNSNDNEISTAEVHVKGSINKKDKKNEIEHDEGRNFKRQSITDESEGNINQKPARRGRRRKEEKNDKNINEEEGMNEGRNENIDIKNSTNVNRGNIVKESVTRPKRKNTKILDGNNKDSNDYVAEIHTKISSHNKEEKKNEMENDETTNIQHIASEETLHRSTKRGRPRKVDKNDEITNEGDEKKNSNHSENIDIKDVNKGTIVKETATRSKRKNTQVLDRNVDDSNDDENTVAEMHVKVSSKNKKDKRNKMEHDEGTNLQTITHANEENTLQKPAKRGRRRKAENINENTDVEEGMNDSYKGNIVKSVTRARRQNTGKLDENVKDANDHKTTVRDESEENIVKVKNITDVGKENVVQKLRGTRRKQVENLDKVQSSESIVHKPVTRSRSKK